MRRARIMVVNGADATLAKELPDVKPSATVRVFVRVPQETGVVLMFTDSEAVLHKETIVGYVEAGDCGNVEVRVLTGNRLVAKGTGEGLFLFCWNSWIDFL